MWTAGKASTGKRWRCVANLTLLLGLLSTGSAQAQFVERALDTADLSETPAHYDLTIRFNCSIRYITHTPATEGTSVSVRLSMGSDCGNVRDESIESPEPAVVRSIELQPLLASDAQLAVLWRGSQQFVVVPTSDQRGLRIRILRAGETNAPQARVTIGEGDDKGVLSGYAINLESSLTPIDDAAVEQARSGLGVRAYVSEVVVDEQRWYRLRVGPITTQADAQKLLLQAQRSYPRAWLAIADETVSDDTPLVEPEGLNSVLDEEAGDSAIKDPQADELWTQARERFQKKDYAASVELLTKLLNRGSRKYRAATQELLGLAHERSSQLAHARADYEAFLREFPKDRRAPRVRRRLNALRTASLPGHKSTGSNDDEASQTWKYYGGISQVYRRDDGSITINNTDQAGNTLANNKQSFTSQNALLNDFDMTARYRGLDVDTRARVSAGYTKDFLSNGPGDQVRVNNAFVEMSDRDRGWYGSIGRQTRTSGGLLGTFDGALASYRFYPHLTVDVAAGFPVDTSHSGVQTKRRFESLATNLGTWANAWEPTFYAVNQTLEGVVDRQAVGAELRYFRPGRVFVGFIDYDVHFQTLNSAVLVGTLQLASRWTLNLDVEQRKSPVISTRNALIGQPVQTLDELSASFSSDEIKQLALDRTPQTSIYSVAIAHPLGERLQFTLNAQSSTTGETPASGGVEGFVAVGPEYAFSAQLLAASIMRSGDINIIGLRYQTGGPVKTTSLGLSSRVPLWNSWRFGPQLRVDHRQIASDNSTQWIYTPGFKLSLQRPTLQIDIEAGGELSKRNTDVTQQNSTRYFYSAGYRWMF